MTALALRSGYKLLTDNRDLAFAQSAMTRNGVVAPFPAGRSQTHQSSPSARASGHLPTTKPATLPAEEF